MRYLIVASLLLSCSLCLAEDLPEETNVIKSLTAEQAADLVRVVTHVRENEYLRLNDLTSIDKGVAQELAKFKGEALLLWGLTSIDKDVLKILKSNPMILLPEKYRDQKAATNKRHQIYTRHKLSLSEAKKPQQDEG